MTVLCLRCLVGFSLVAASRGSSSWQGAGFSFQWLLIAVASHVEHRLSGARVSVAAAPGL